MVRWLGVLMATVVFVTSLAFADEAFAEPVRPVGSLAAASLRSPAPIDGEAVLAALPSGPDGVLTEPPSVPVLPPEPKVADPVVEGFDAELSVEDVSQRDVFSSVFDNVDGTETAVFSSMAVNFQDGDCQIFCVSGRGGHVSRRR